MRIITSGKAESFKDEQPDAYQEKSYFVLTKGNIYINNVNLFKRGGVCAENEVLKLFSKNPSKVLLFRNL